jgi:single-strand DNA-binding protein
MLNHITIMGRLTRDPELRYTGNNIPVCSFTLAVDRDFGTRDGGEKQTDFIDCVAWRSTGEFVNKYFSKGSMAVVAGRLELRDWTDRDGNKRRNAEVNAEHVYFGESKRSEGGQAHAQQQGNRQSSYQQPRQSHGYGNSFAELEDDDGDLPF